MKVHLECERMLYFQTEDRRKGILSEGSEAYMHFVTPKIDLWMQACVVALKDKIMTVRSNDGAELTFAYRSLKDVSDKMPAAMEKENVRHLVAALRPVPHAELPDSFEKAVCMLSRPYYDLTPQQVRYIQKLASEGGSDVLEDTRTGVRYIWGDAEGGVKLMRLTSAALHNGFA